MPQNTSYRPRLQGASTVQERANRSRPNRPVATAGTRTPMIPRLQQSSGVRDAAMKQGRDFDVTPGDRGGLQPIPNYDPSQPGQVELLRGQLGLDANNAMPPGTQFAQSQNPVFRAWQAGQTAQTQQVVADAQRQRAEVAAGEPGRARYFDSLRNLGGRNMAASGVTPQDVMSAVDDPQMQDRLISSMPRMSSNTESALNERLAREESYRRMGGRVDERMVAPGGRFAPQYAGADLASAGGAGGAGAMMSVPDQSMRPRLPAERSQVTNPQVGATAAGQPAIPLRQLPQVHNQIRAFRDGVEGVNQDTLASRIGEMGLELRDVQFNEVNPRTGEPVPGQGFTAQVFNPQTGRAMTIPVPGVEQQERMDAMEGTPAQRASVRGLAGRTGIGREEGEDIDTYQGRLVAAGRALRQQELDRREQNRNEYFASQAGRSFRPQLETSRPAETGLDSPYRYANTTIPEKPSLTDVNSAREYLKTSYPALAEFIGVGESKGRTKADIQQWLDENGYAVGSKERRDIENALAMVEKALATPAQRTGQIREPQSPLSKALGVRRLQPLTPEARERIRQQFGQ